MTQFRILYGLIALLAAACVFSLVQVQSVQHNQNYALRSIMCFAESYVSHSPKATPQQKQDAIRFYSEALAKANLSPCAR